MRMISNTLWMDSGVGTIPCGSGASTTAPWYHLLDLAVIQDLTWKQNPANFTFGKNEERGREDGLSYSSIASPPQP